jgi:hypothetical protein
LDSLTSFSVLAIQLAIVGAGFAYLLGSRKLMRTALGVILSGVLAQFLLTSVDPDTRRMVFLAFLPFLVLILAERLLRMLLGPQVAGQVVGTWAVRFFDALFRVPGALLRRFRR